MRLSKRSASFLALALSVCFSVLLSCASDPYERYTEPGLYHESRKLAKTTFEFERKPMRGIMINHYADGCYYVVPDPTNFLKVSEPLKLYIVPNRPVTLGGADEWEGTVFEVRRSLVICRVEDNGRFVCVDRGVRQRGEVTCPTTALVDEVEEARGGVVKHRKQLVEIDFAVPKGKYVIFEGEGNARDRDVFPAKKQGCWYIQVI